MSQPDRTVLLFDVDGVLLHPRGYKQALIASLDVFAERMSLPPTNITMDEIAIFESVSLTNEWDSMALCAGALLINALAVQPDALRDTVAETQAVLATHNLDLPRPDFTELARRVMADHDPAVMPSRHIRDTLGKGIPEGVRVLLSEMLDDVYYYRAPLTYIFQHYTLGSEGFAETYGEEATIDSHSFLRDYDKPHLREDIGRRLQEKAAEDSLHYVIFTARPSRPPVGIDMSDLADAHRYPPEGDLAAKSLAMLGSPPLIAGGRVTWLAGQRGQGVAAYIKPSPVQALAAIGAAVSGDEVASLQAAAALIEDGILTAPLDSIRDGTTHVAVFEDSTGGIHATKGAVAALRDVGFEVTLDAVGVSPDENKRASLARVADRLVNDINEGLEVYLAD